MTVLLVSHLYPSLLSSTWGSFVHNQARFLAQRLALRVVSPVPWTPVPIPGAPRWSSLRELPEGEERDGITVLRPRYGHLPRRLWPALTIRRFAAALRDSMTPAPRVIHAHCAFPDGAAALVWGKRLGVPVVITVHGHDVKVLPRLGRRWRARIARTLREAQAVIAVSRELEALVVDLGVPAERVHRIPNGVDCQQFTAPVEGASVEGVPAARVPGEGGWRLLYIGRFDVAKGLEDLLRALRFLCDDGRDIRLDLVGGNALSGPAAPFQALADELGLTERVRFHDEVAWSQVPAWMAAADLFVLPSHSEGLPLVLLEALAAGLPVVSTRCGGPVEVVDDETGRLAEVADPADLARAIAAVVNRYVDYDRDAIRRRAARDYDYRAVAARIHELYDEVAGAPVSSGAAA